MTDFINPLSSFIPHTHMTVPKSDIVGIFCVPSGRLEGSTFAIVNKKE